MILDTDITVSCDDWALSLPDARALCRRAAQAAYDEAAYGGAAYDEAAYGGAAHAGAPGDAGAAEVSIVLGDDALLQGLNRDYRGIDAPTNVLSFPGESTPGSGESMPGPIDGRPRVLGDVIVAYQTARAEAADADRPLGDHLCHLVVHGMLHLLGHDHRSDGKAEAMERLEVRVLAGLGVADPYAPATLRPEKGAAGR